MSTSASGQMKETNFQRFGNHTPRESVNQTTPMCGALLCTQHWACPSSPSGDVQLCGTLRKDVCFSPNFCAICFLPHPLLQHLESVLCIPESRECGFPGGLVVKNLPANTGDVGLIPVGLMWGRSPGERNGNSLQYSCLGDPMDRRAWWATVHGVGKELKMT